MNMKIKPDVTIVIATYNRADELKTTLEFLGQDDDHLATEIIVVDNGSTDDSAAVAASLADRVVQRVDNQGSCAKAWGADEAEGRYLLFLDDDAVPRPGVIRALIDAMDENERLGGIGLRVMLPTGDEEGAASPGVPIGCGVAYRAEAYKQSGGLDRSFFMQAEEYDLSFRLVQHGWRVEVRDDLVVDHRKTNTGRIAARTLYYDVRNNIRLAARYLPDPAYGMYEEDWSERYAWLADSAELETALLEGLHAGGKLAKEERPQFNKLDNRAFEFFFRWQAVERWMSGLRSDGVRKLICIALGKNILAFHQAANRTGCELVAIGDDRFSAAGRQYRGIPVVPLGDALKIARDSSTAVVISNLAVVHAASMYRRLTGRIDAPIHVWQKTNADYEFVCLRHPEYAWGQSAEPGGS